MLTHPTLDYTHISEYWIYLLGIILLTISVSIQNIKTTWIIYFLSIGVSFILRFLELNTLPNIFLTYFLIVLVSFLISLYNFTNIMEKELEKVSYSIEYYGKENLLIDILNCKDKIDAEYLINYYKIRVLGDRTKCIESINKIILPENFRLCSQEEMKIKLVQFMNNIKKEKVQIINSVYMFGFTPSNSMVKFYIKLLSIKRAITLNSLNNSLNNSDDFNNKIYSKLSSLKNKITPLELLNFTYVTSIPDYKINDQKYIQLLDKTLISIEKYFDAYDQNNFYF